MSKHIDSHEFAARTYMTRKMFGETQVQYAKRLGVCERTVRNWEREKVSKPIQKNFEHVQRRYRYFKTETKQGVQVEMKRKSDDAIIWSIGRSFEDLLDTMIEHDWYRAEYEIKGFRRINLMRSTPKKKRSSKKRILTTADEMIKAYG